MSNTNTLELIAFQRKEDSMYVTSIEEIDDIVIYNYHPDIKKAFYLKKSDVYEFLSELNKVDPDNLFNDFNIVLVDDK